MMTSNVILHQHRTNMCVLNDRFFAIFLQSTREFIEERKKLHDNNSNNLIRVAGKTNQQSTALRKTTFREIAVLLKARTEK